MNKNFCFIDLPDFQIEYDAKTEYGYKNKPGANLNRLLKDISENHCMYCYALLRSDRVDTGELEHSIEKSLSDFLINCVPNLALVCRNCNISLKRKGEKKRIGFLNAAVKEFERNLNCKSIHCKKECRKYIKLKEYYSRYSKIILRPGGMKGMYTKLDYCIQYDVIKAEFIPSQVFCYSKEDLDYIEHHINQFKLNDFEFKTRALIHFVEDTINADGKYIKRNNSYSNYIVDLFVRKLEGLSREEVLRICEELYVQYQMHCCI